MDVGPEFAETCVQALSQLQPPLLCLDAMAPFVQLCVEDASSDHVEPAVDLAGEGRVMLLHERVSYSTQPDKHVGLKLLADILVLVSVFVYEFSELRLLGWQYGLASDEHSERLEGKPSQVVYVSLDRRRNCDTASCEAATGIILQLRDDVVNQHLLQSRTEVSTSAVESLLKSCILSLLILVGAIVLVERCLHVGDYIARVLGYVLTVG
jgi:hypothetical protein